MSFALFSQQGLYFFMKWLHFFFGIAWIGHLYYFNFVQGAFFAETDAGTKNNVTSKLVPRALWWFRWGAMLTFLTGWSMIEMRARLSGWELFMTSWGTVILTGAILGSLMWANVWFVIWPAQKVVIASAQAVVGGGQANPAAAARGARALVASRTNTMFSIAMLFCMGAAANLPIQMGPESNLTLYWVLAVGLMAALQANALLGKTGPMTTIRGVISSGFVLTAGLYLLMEFCL
ncbi:MAG: urate hydroxylase PuuD [Bdellovibrionales bacterium]|nr:urate hydroxylase PuuD [Bdellovibrionales bacterium]